jgi:hypothetical protein
MRTGPNPQVQRAGIARAGRARWVSLLEAILGSLIVIGDNVWHVLPNSVALLCAMALICFRLREGNWSVSGLRWPSAWRRISDSLALVLTYTGYAG